MAATKNTKSITIPLTAKKETPGTFVFEEAKPADGSRVVIGTLYVSKAALGTDVQPKSITVTVVPA